MQKTAAEQGSAAAATSSHRSLRLIIDRDDRVICPASKFPMTAVGQLDFTLQGSPFICTGVLFKPDRVLTAAHCVWDEASRAFVDGVGFAPGRYRTPSGQIMNPYGIKKWKHVTLFQEYAKSNEARADIAVVQLQEPVSKDAGTMGVKVVCSKDAVQLTTGGYPSDKDLGTCIQSTCKVNIDCTADAAQHTCDTYSGQSGSPFWDPQYFVRGIHVRGYTAFNEFTTVTQYVLDTINKW